MGMTRNRRIRNSMSGATDFFWTDISSVSNVNVASAAQTQTRCHVNNVLYMKLGVPITHTNTSRPCEFCGITGAKLVILTKGITNWASTFLINQLMRDGISLPKRRLSNASGSTTLSYWVKVLHPTRHKIGHFADVPQANLLAWYGKTKPNTTKTCIHQSKEMYYNTK